MRGWSLLLLWLGLCGCSSSLGATFGRASPFGGSTPAVVTGVRWAQLVQPQGDRGLVAGYEAELQAQTFNQPGFAMRAQAQAGWADAPLGAHRLVGREVTMRLGYTSFPRDGDKLHAFAFGPRFAAPIRLTDGCSRTNAGVVTTRTWLLLPEIGGNIALAPGERLRFDFALALSARFQLSRRPSK